MSVQRKVWGTFADMSILQRVLAVAAGLLVTTFLVLFLVFNERIFAWLGPVAEDWRDLPFGWGILWAATFICAFPPVIGYSTSVTIAGFVYGFPNGWFIVASATVVGSFCSFITCRTVLSGYVHRLVGEDKRFNALALTLKHDGLKILCMIRLCPLPYSISNGAMSTFHTIEPLQFALATAIASPKLAIHVFIGSRLGSIAEGGQKMDASTKAINYASVAGGMILGAAVGWIIYQRTMKRAKELEIEEREALRQAAVAGRQPSADGTGFTDGIDDPTLTDAAALMNDDDISLWDNDNDDAEGGYRDDFTDDSRDEEAAIESKGIKKAAK